MSEQWYWCLTHQEVEPASGCRLDDRMGPYATPEEARRWRERLEQRRDDWTAQDEAHDGPKDDWEREDERWRNG
jgi:hypothetical protein